MPRVATTLTVSDGTIRWAMVTVFDVDGNIVREYPITKAQYDAFIADPKGVPPLMLRATWESGRAFVAGRPCLRGMCYVQPDGSLIINRGRRTIGQRIEQRFGNIAAGKWGMNGSVVEVDDDVIDEATVDPALGD